MNDLKLFLKKLPTGIVCGEPHSKLVRFIQDCWCTFSGSDAGGIQPDKLLDRTERLTWKPPILSFTIERHGATVLGSSRAVLQSWTLDLEKMTATCESKRYRQLTRRAPPLKVEPIAEELVKCILQHRENPHLKWIKKGGVRVLTSELLGGGSEQTLNGRRKRLGEAITRLLEPHGWGSVDNGIYKPLDSIKEG